MNKKYQGFTLLEAMIVISLLAILAAMAYPSFQSTIAHNRAKVGGMQINKALAYARSEANSLNRAVGLCPVESKDAKDTKVCGNNADWSNGFFIYIDQDRNYSYNESVDGEPIQYFNLKYPVNLNISNNIDRFTWEPGGLKLSKNASQQPANATIVITPSDNPQETEYQRECRIAVSGRVLCE